MNDVPEGQSSSSVEEPAAPQNFVRSAESGNAPTARRGAAPPEPGQAESGPLLHDLEDVRSHPHKNDCFVVMPFGETQEEQRWFKGWYEAVIKPAVIQAGLDPILAAAVNEPNAINDEIRGHLSFDPMVLVDLGGHSVDQPPNPNVMYELGIRHAMDLPVVLLAWQGQRLPFDIGNQRTLTSARDFLDQHSTLNRLVEFIEKARAGNFYRPMDAVGRRAALEVATSALAPENVLKALADEVRDLREALHRSAPSSKPAQKKKKKKVNRPQLTHVAAAGPPDFKNSLKKYFLANGGDQKGWGLAMAMFVDELDVDPKQWSEREWKEFLANLVRSSRDAHSADTNGVLS